MITENSAQFTQQAVSQFGQQLVAHLSQQAVGQVVNGFVRHSSLLTCHPRLRGNDVVCTSEYQLTQSLPENLQSQLPSVEEIEQELGGEL